ncbi:MAG: 3-phosphoshikimate 1-carboxyvinyltransferase [Thermoproteota archaeon]|nr:3-phosphoshikimate 1-carboxyvinyltransferase [Thermoproteota archaeon]
MTSIVVRRSRLNGTVRCPSSKSYTHRAIAIASLADQPSTITHVLLARDTLATLNGCGALGADIKYRATNMRIKGSHCFNPPENVINAENSGTTIRILTAMSGLVRTGYTVLTGDESLRSRPMQPLLDALRQLGVEAYSTKENGMPPIIVKGGGIKGGTTVVDGSISSQFISGLLIVSIYADSDIIIKVRGRLVSKPYIRATLATMKHFGVSIDHSPDMLEYYIKNTRYHGTRFDVPSDFSTAALILTAGTLAGEKLRVNGLNFEMPQGDSRIIDILKKMGCRIIVDEEKGEVVISGADRLEGGDFNLADTPDLLPVVSILALKATSPVTITGVAHARVKETDRVSNIAAELIKFGAHINEFRDGLKITAPLVIKNASLEAHNDHRLFMAFTIASMMTEKSIVAGAQSVDVSYPNFISDMKNIGARISPAPDRE